MIIGSPGAGKSFFSTKLHKLTGIPLHHLDQIFWKPGWKKSDKKDFRKRVEKLVKKDTWIIDGNYESTIDVRAIEADTIIFFDYSRWPCLWGCCKRFFNDHLLGKNRPDMTTDCRARFDWSLIVFIWTYSKNGKINALNKIEAVGFPLKDIVFLRNAEEKQRYFESIRIEQ